MITSLEKRLKEDYGCYETDLKLIVSCFSPLMFKKNEFLLRSGDSCKHIYFVAAGCVRSYYVNDLTGKETTRNIFLESKFCTVLSSFIDQSPTDEWIQAVEDSKLLAMDRMDFFRLLHTVPSWEQFYRQKLERTRKYDQWRFSTFLNLDASERYEQTLIRYPELCQRVSNKILASYLGIAQESLSRIKNVRGK